MRLKWLKTNKDAKVRLHKLLLRVPLFVETFLVLQADKFSSPSPLLLLFPVTYAMAISYRHRMACKECVTQMKLPKPPTHSTIHTHPLPTRLLKVD